jgi:spoIIIJ-associated protein
MTAEQVLCESKEEAGIHIGGDQEPVTEPLEKPENTEPDTIKKAPASTSVREKTPNKRPAPEIREDKIFDAFYDEAPDPAWVAQEVEKELRNLFSHTCFSLDRMEVSPYDEETILIEIEGDDAALLIGKEGYRYKALVYMLYSWIHGKYGYRVRLEIAKFLKNQEAMIEKYLESVIERVENEGRAHTKVLDGILVQIALKMLRDRFPDKYVAIRTNREGGRYVMINEFMEKR